MTDKRNRILGDGDLVHTITRSERDPKPKPARSKHEFTANDFGQCSVCGRRPRDVYGRKTHK